MWVHTRIMFNAILILTLPLGQTVAKKGLSISKPKAKVAKRVLDLAKKLPGKIDGISSHYLQSMIDGSNAVIKNFKRGHKWFNELRRRLAKDRYPDFKGGGKAKV